jgi:phytoene dehydrogenase-like protein
MANTTKRRACIVGAGPNGLAAAVVLAERGLHVDIFEAEPQVGGAARTLPLTLPGFHHDFGSAVHPLAAGSPFFNSLPLQQYGLEWIHPPAPLAHPLDDGTAVVLERDWSAAEDALGRDAKAWRKLIGPIADNWAELSVELLGPVPLIPKHPLKMARFGLNGVPSAKTIANRYFTSERTKALFAGLAAHSFLSLDEPLSAAIAIMLGATAHAVGWPIPKHGAQSISDALCEHLSQFDITVKTSTRIEGLSQLENYDLTFCDVTPHQLLRMAKGRFTPTFARLLSRFRYGPGVFKVDYALSAPIPWRAAECSRAATVHIGGSFAEIAASEAAMRAGNHAERPFVLLSQPTLFDQTRAPAGQHVAWAYCHVPNGSNFDMLDRLERQIERFAPGFRDCVLARNIFSPSLLEKNDANLVGGDVNGGMMDIRQFLFRPTWRHYATSARDIYICSSSTPPGGGVHGMCGYHAAKLAIKKLKL